MKSSDEGKTLNLKKETPPQPGFSQRDVIGAGLNMGRFLHPGKSLAFISASCPATEDFQFP